MKNIRRFEGFYDGGKAILVGNGLNLTAQGISWNTLLENIKNKFSLNHIEINEKKSYPLVFEEILFSMHGHDFDSNLKSLKQFIFSQYKLYKPNEIHKKLILTGVKEILTTNYDYTLERCLNSQFNGEKKGGVRNTYKYSLSRYYKFDDLRIWHIHGELNNGLSDKGNLRYPEESIMIGNEHYADYFRKVHEKFKPGPKGLIEVLNTELDFWGRFFFTHDLHILGFDINFSEFHLWWILNYRARLIKKDKSISNTIFYYYPCFNEAIKKNTIDILKVLKVKCISVHADDYKKFYFNAIQRIKK